VVIIGLAFDLVVQSGTGRQWPPAWRWFMDYGGRIRSANQGVVAELSWRQVDAAIGKVS
jgi:hypothetical protein